MFDEIIIELEKNKEEFISKVKDSFGYSIENKVYKPVIEKVYELNQEYEITEMKMREIDTITMELRMIL